MAPPEETTCDVAVVGLGLIGGSIALAARRAGLARFLGTGGHVVHRGAHRLHAAVDTHLHLLDEASDVLCGVAGALRQAADLVRDHREAATLLASSRIDPEPAAAELQAQTTLARAVLADREAALGPEHPDVGETAAELADVLEELWLDPAERERETAKQSQLEAEKLREAARDGQAAAERERDAAVAARAAVRRRRDVLLQTLAHGSRDRREHPGLVAEMLEPNLKEAPGGLRDLFGAQTIAMLTDPALLALGGPGARALEDAEEFLLRVRSVLHLEAGRHHNVLRHELQERVAERLVADRLAALEAEHAEAVAAMATFQDQEWNDWTQMAFD